METCVLCRQKFEADGEKAPAVLYINRYGARRVLCADCERLLDIAISDAPEKELAQGEILKKSFNIREPEGVAVLKAALEGEAVPHEVTEEELAEEADLYEDKEGEDGDIQEEEPRGIGEYIPLICFGAVFVVFLVWFFFFK
ncbi:MAG: hypothetical protein J6K61_01005 [Clostridia bacterium]|nr:hypothetical protein [Clostridia bacterium]